MRSNFQEVKKIERKEQSTKTSLNEDKPRPLAVFLSRLERTLEFTFCKFKKLTRNCDTGIKGRLWEWVYSTLGK